MINMIALRSPFSNNEVYILGNKNEKPYLIKIGDEIESSNTEAFGQADEMIKILPLIVGDNIHILASENIYSFKVDQAKGDVLCQILDNRGLTHIWGNNI